MPSYRIYVMKETPRRQFRSAPHVSGETAVKRRDYDESSLVEAASEYAAWTQLRESDTPLGVGDLLETDSGELRICKYVGFEAARWVLPEDKLGMPMFAPEAVLPAQPPAE